MPKDARDVAAGLQKKGFRRRDNDHTFFHLWVDDRKTSLFTKISHGEREIGDNLLSVMARQLRLSRRQFLNLINCPLTEEDLVQMLREEGHIE